jgi:enamine deaminase RidA (YjgF/YER057c/UK114 family)
MMENVARVLNAAGCSFDDVFKSLVMLADVSQWMEFNKVYLEYFKPERLPVRSAFGANGLALGAAVEMECWVWAGEREGHNTDLTLAPIGR